MSKLSGNDIFSESKKATPRNTQGFGGGTLGYRKGIGGGGGMTTKILRCTVKPQSLYRYKIDTATWI